MAIGIFDSGVGGINLLNRVRKAYPNHEIHYYADQDHVPYGYHKPSDILTYVDDAADFLYNQGCSVLLLACNTATSVAAEHLRKKNFMSIVGMEPALKPAFLYLKEKHLQKKILVTATPVTVKLPKMQRLIKQLHAAERVELLAMPELVDFAEKGLLSGMPVEDYFQKKFVNIDAHLYGAVVFGCTHFSYFKEYFQSVFGSEMVFFDGYDGTVKRLQSIIKENKMVPPKKTGQVYYWVSGRPVSEKKFVSWLA